VKRVYPQAINNRFISPRNAGGSPAANAEGRAATFLCGTRTQFRLAIDPDSKRIEAANFRTNGCGFMVAAADVLAEIIATVKLTDLHGIDIPEFQRRIEDELGEFPPEREHCLLTAIDALRAALADFRTRQIEEFTGEKALVCTCFGVSEETVEKVIQENGTSTVAQVGELCNAGTGCGSCQFMIQEMIDAAGREIYQTTDEHG
jgi:NifU-like protein